MKLENSFEVPAPPDLVWAYLIDVERVVPCMPGAELTEVVDETTWKGEVRVTLGPVSLTYKGTVDVQERDDEARAMKMRAKGTEATGKGMAQATVTSTVMASDDGSRVEILTDLVITGAAAQFGRGMVADVSQRFTDEFAECLSRRMAGPQDEGAEGAEGEAGASPATKPISGIRVGLWALWRAVVRFFRRIWKALTGGGGEG